ncbi:MAG: ubiquinol-cytochrome c reductase iron-sulfur subunit [Verrucomicrobia bacterium]|nr:ubiquinol-cytochrome c reductase iron-sulfur subunit [Verrucomicrobiota bacterium]
MTEASHDGEGKPTSCCQPCAGCGCQKKAGMTRIGFIAWMGAGWAAFAAAMGGFATMLARFLAPNVDYEPSQSFRVGSPDEYGEGVATQWKAKYGIWVVRLEDRIIALSTTCTHLGCTPNWLDSEGKFKCPCHGSGFRQTGINFEGPAPRPLERYKIQLEPSGDLLVDKTVVFRAEKGQWDDPQSYVAV